MEEERAKAFVALSTNPLWRELVEHINDDRLRAVADLCNPENPPHEDSFLKGCIFVMNAITQLPEKADEFLKSLTEQEPEG